ncbi:MAG: DUF58 domain-containing protein [Deltaproteobacteria bacterium]
MSRELIDIKAASKLKGFHFGAKSRASGYASGIHKSAHKGVSPDFLEYKEYSEGDELKRVDWRLYGRQDRLYVRKFEDEAILRWLILVDRSASMGYGSGGGETKLDYAKRLGATLAYLLLKQGDSVGISDFSADAGRGDCEAIAPRSGASQITRITERLGALRAGGGTLIKQAALSTIERIRGDAALVVISDFLTEAGGVRESLRLISASRKKAFFFHVLDAGEMDFNFEGIIEFEDLEDGSRVLVDAGDIREAYRGRMRRFIAETAAVCHENGAAHILAPTNAPIEDALLQIAVK